MAHYAFLDSNNIVTQVIVGKNENEPDNNGVMQNWEEFYGKELGQVCKRTSYNTNANQHTNGGTPFRGNYAQPGYYYDPSLDAFIPPKPYDSWKLDYDTFLWIPPVPKPPFEEGYYWMWIEINKEWVKFPL